MKQITTTILFLLFFCQTNLVVAQQNNDTLQAEPKLKRGIYLSIEELYNNAPSITEPFVLSKIERTSKGWLGSYSYWPQFVETKKKAKKVVGFCDGQKRYIFFNEEFFEIEKKGNEYSFWSYANPDRLYVIEIEGRTRTFRFNKEDAKNIRVNYILDQSSGRIYNRKIYERIGYELVIYRRAKNEKGNAVNIIINDSMEYSFIPNSYQNLLFRIGGPDVKICVEGETECVFVKSDSLTIKYLKVSSLLKEEEVKLEKVNWDQGEYEVIVPYRKQKRRKRLKTGPKVNFGKF